MVLYKPRETYIELSEALRTGGPITDEMVKKAMGPDSSSIFSISREIFRGAKRELGEPFLTHCADTATRMWDHYYLQAHIDAALSHDWLEHLVDKPKKFPAKLRYIATNLAATEIPKQRQDELLENMLVLTNKEKLLIELIKKEVQHLENTPDSPEKIVQLLDRIQVEKYDSITVSDRTYTGLFYSARERLKTLVKEHWVDDQETKQTPWEQLNEIAYRSYCKGISFDARSRYSDQFYDVAIIAKSFDIIDNLRTVQDTVPKLENMFRKVQIFLEETDLLVSMYKTDGYNCDLLEVSRDFLIANTYEQLNIKLTGLKAQKKAGPGAVDTRKDPEKYLEDKLSLFRKMYPTKTKNYTKYRAKLGCIIATTNITGKKPHEKSLVDQFKLFF